MLARDFDVTAVEDVAVIVRIEYIVGFQLQCQTLAEEMFPDSYVDITCGFQVVIGALSGGSGHHVQINDPIVRQRHRIVPVDEKVWPAEILFCSTEYVGVKIAEHTGSCLRRPASYRRLRSE